MAEKKFDLSGYVDVAERMRDFHARYPEGTIQTLRGPEMLTFDVEQTFTDPQTQQQHNQIVKKAFVFIVAGAYRTPDDQRPGVGIAWEPVPGLTPYTRNSEAQNAETAAWGRAILAVGGFHTDRGIASAQEVQNRQAEGDSTQVIADPLSAQPLPPVPASLPPSPEVAAHTAQQAPVDAQIARIDPTALSNLSGYIQQAVSSGKITPDDLKMILTSVGIPLVGDSVSQTLPTLTREDGDGFVKAIHTLWQSRAE